MNETREAEIRKLCDCANEDPAQYLANKHGDAETIARLKDLLK